MSLTLGDLKTATSNQLDWTALLDAIMAKASGASNLAYFTDDTELFVPDLPTLKAFVEVISQTPTPVVINFLLVQSVQVTLDMYSSNSLNQLQNKHFTKSQRFVMRFEESIETVATRI